MSYGYDGAANLVDVTDVAGGNTHFSYDAAHRMLTMRDPRAGTVTNVYDGAGRVQSQTDAMNRTTAFDYTSVFASTKVTLPAGNVVVDKFRAGLVASHTVGYGTAQSATWQREYDGVTFGCTKITDPNFRTLSRTYDAAGNVLTSTDGLYRTTMFTYDALNNLKR